MIRTRSGKKINTEQKKKRRKTDALPDRCNSLDSQIARRQCRTIKHCKPTATVHSDYIVVPHGRKEIKNPNKINV